MLVDALSVRCRKLAIGLVAAAAVVTLPVGGDGSVWADDLVNVVRVEEDWQLVLGNPDPDTDAPQITCVLSAAGDLNASHATLDVNVQTLPEFVAGGAQLQAWSAAEQLLGMATFSGGAFSTPGEVVTWTTRMELDDGKLRFSVVNGQSGTWGAFGGDSLAVSVGTSLDTLNAYSPQVSVANSRVGFASNLVRSLVLQRVRLITATGQEIKDGTSRVVFQHD